MRSFDSIFNTFSQNIHGTTADDFYFIYSTSGKKLYYARFTGKRTPIDCIPKGILNEIKEKSRPLTNAELIEQKRNILKQIDRLNEKVAEIDRELNGAETQGYEEELRKEKLERDASMKRNKRENRESFERLFGNRDNKSQYPPKKKQKIEASESEINFLASLSIRSKKDWKEWLLKNHPDKGGTDNELCKIVISYGNNMNWK